jgi:hypothetical protein
LRYVVQKRRRRANLSLDKLNRARSTPMNCVARRGSGSMCGVAMMKAIIMSFI